MQLGALGRELVTKIAQLARLCSLDQPEWVKPNLQKV